MNIGSLCTGIGGLDLAVEAHFGAELAWYSEVEPAPCVVLERTYPGVANLGDLTVIDWVTVPLVDVLTAGYPCQPFSHAGKRKGRNDERHLWPYIAAAVRVLRPRWVVLENVAGHLTLGFGDVLGDLAEAGFDAEWCVLRASDVGAPISGHDCSSLLPTPVGSDVKGAQAATAEEWQAMKDAWGDKPGGPCGQGMLSTAVALLPTPVVNDMGAGKTPEAWDQWTDEMKERHGNGNGHGRSLSIEAARLLPTPAAWDGDRGPDYARANRKGSGGDDLVTTVAKLLPTHVARDASGGRNKTSGRKAGSKHHDGTTLTDWAWMHEGKPSGVTTPPPSPDGNWPWDAPLPPPPSTAS